MDFPGSRRFAEVFDECRRVRAAHAMAGSVKIAAGAAVISPSNSNRQKIATCVLAEALPGDIEQKDLIERAIGPANQPEGSGHTDVAGNSTAFTLGNDHFGAGVR